VIDLETLLDRILTKKVVVRPPEVLWAKDLPRLLSEVNCSVAEIAATAPTLLSPIIARMGKVYVMELTLGV